MTDREFHVLTKLGEASDEVEEVVREFGGKEKAGLHRYFYVARAHQTVVMATDHDVPIARVLRDRKGWKEPTDPSAT